MTEMFKKKLKRREAPKPSEIQRIIKETTKECDKSRIYCTKSNVVKWHPFADYKYIVLSEPFENKVIIMGINTDYIGYAPIDELVCTGKTAKITIEMKGDTDERQSTD